MVMLNFKLRRQHMKVIHQLLFSEAFATWYYVWCHVLIVNIDFYIFVSFEFIFLFGGGGGWTYIWEVVILERALEGAWTQTPNLSSWKSCVTALTFTKFQIRTLGVF